MRKAVKIYLICMACYICGVAFGGVALYSHDWSPTNYQYKGVETFASWDDYHEFDRFYKENDCSSCNYDILSKTEFCGDPIELPIVVSYTVELPRDKEFPYAYFSKIEEEGNPWHSGATEIWVGGGVFGIVIFSIAANDVFPYKGKRRKSREK